MSARHTPGRLVCHSTPNQPEIKNQDGDTIGYTTPYRWSDARRLAACWNACESIPTEWLEQNRIQNRWAEEVRSAPATAGDFVDAKRHADLLAHLDELLAACRQAEPVLADLERLLQARAPGFEGLAALQAVRQAIAKAAA